MANPVAVVRNEVKSFEDRTPISKSVLFWCPGCDDVHRVTVETPDGWGWNGDLERPTFTPSVLMRARHWEPPVTPENLEQWKREPWEQRPVDRVCHSFVTDGRIQFLGDSTHQLAGQTVDMVPLPDWLVREES